MREETFAIEARKCRNLALRYLSGPEQRLLINVAAAFEDLAQNEKAIHASTSGGNWPRPASTGTGRSRSAGVGIEF